MSREDQRTLDGWLSPCSGARESTSESRRRQSSNRPTFPTTSREPDQSSRTPAAGSSRSRHGQGASTRRGTELAAVAKETRTVLPGILACLPDVQASTSEALYLESLPPLHPGQCPRHPAAVIKVVNDDTFNAAILMASTLPAPSSSSAATPTVLPSRVVVLNMASNFNPGGGWLKGATAQEEALCYRSSLSLSLHRGYYPFEKQRMAIYTPDVVVIRADMGSGHKLLVPDVSPDELPVVSVLSIAALRRPRLRPSRAPPGSSAGGRDEYANPRDRDTTKDKMRLFLRAAAQKGHTRLVLGALGCGAFGNPKEVVAACWKEVLQEGEFQGGWWEAVWFAVYDRRNEGNFECFDEVLGGTRV